MATENEFYTSMQEALNQWLASGECDHLQATEMSSDDLFELMNNKFDMENKSYEQLLILLICINEKLNSLANNINLSDQELHYRDNVLPACSHLLKKVLLCIKHNLDSFDQLVNIPDNDLDEEIAEKKKDLAVNFDMHSQRIDALENALRDDTVENTEKTQMALDLVNGLMKEANKFSKKIEWVRLETLFNRAKNLTEQLPFFKHPIFTTYLAHIIEPGATQQKYEEACQKLETACNETNIDLYQTAGRNVLNRIKDVKKGKICTDAEIEKLTKFANDAAQLIKSPILTLDNNPHLSNHRDNTKDALGMRGSKFKLVAASMAVLFGVGLMLASIGLAVATYGFSTPLSALGMATAVSLIAGSAGVGLVTTCVASFFTHKQRKGDLHLAMTELKQAAKARLN